MTATRPWRLGGVTLLAMSRAPSQRSKTTGRGRRPTRRLLAMGRNETLLVEVVSRVHADIE